MKPTPPEINVSMAAICLSPGYMMQDWLPTESIAELEVRMLARWRAQRKREREADEAAVDAELVIMAGWK